MTLSMLHRLGAKEPFDPLVLPSGPVRAGFYLWCAATAFVLLSLTALTFNLDDVKIPGLFVGGGLCLVAWAILWCRGEVETPHPLLWGTYGAWLLANVASTLVAPDYGKWVGWYYVQFSIALLGFILLGSGTIRTKKMAELALKFWVLIAFATTAFGLIHYSGLLERFYQLIWNNAPLTPDSTKLQALLKTFISARSMLSTILNVQFFGNFLLMLIPVVASCTVLVFRNMQRRVQAGESTAVPIAWATISALSVVFSLTCIFTTYSKSALVFLPALGIAYALAVYFFCGIRRIPYLGIILPLGLVMGGTVLAFVWGDLMRELKNVEESMAPRRMIYGGAWAIFQEYPILGGGPGSFRLHFPEFRDPDYHLTRISNLTLYAHNWVLDLLAENGVLGTGAYLAFLGAMVWLGIKALRACPDAVLRVAIVGCVLGVASLLAGSLLNPMSRWPVGAVSLHAMIGTAFGVILLALKDPEQLRREFPGEGRTKRRAEEKPPVIHNAPLRYGVLAFASIALVISGQSSIRGFQSAVQHNEGLALSEGIPQHLLGNSPTLTNPKIIELFRRAERHFLEAIRLDPTRVTTYYKLAHVYNRLGETELALKAYRDLQKFFPDYAEVHFNLAVIYFNLATDEATPPEQAADYITRCLESFERARKLSNKVSVWFYAANAAYTAAQMAAPGSAEQKALFLEAGEKFLATAQLPISTVIQEQGQEARESDQRFRALGFAAECFSKGGDPLRAAEAMVLAVHQDPSSQANIRKAISSFQQAEATDRALALLDELIAVNPVDGRLHALRLQALADAERHGEALEYAKFILLLEQKLQAEGVQFAPEELLNSIRSVAQSVAKKVTSESATP
jgi:tetratricopeptide (TPR) repeat protein